MAFAALALGGAVGGPALAQDEVDFEAEVWPILMDNCVVCHGPVDSFGELRLDSKEGILKGGKNGKIVVPGEPEKSPMYVRTSLPADDLDIMPAEGDPLTPEQVELIRRWIAGGAELGEWAGL
ncbi:MAG: c-type cytochrome domain-containing protein [Thermoanaerobaculia bacterium]|nr:c-type cytochrome domain-containing protein [Thermoanaerobaculia bacterium]